MAAEGHDRRVVKFQPGRRNLAHQQVLYLQFGNGLTGRPALAQQLKGGVFGPHDPAHRLAMGLDVGLIPHDKMLQQIGAGDDLHAAFAHPLDGTGVDIADVGHLAARTVFHGHPPAAGQGFAQQRVQFLVGAEHPPHDGRIGQDLLPGGGLDAVMDQRCRPAGGNIQEPAPGQEFARDMQQLGCERVEAFKIVEQPAVQVRGAHNGLNFLEFCFRVHVYLGSFVCPSRAISSWYNALRRAVILPGCPLPI